jgi:hypothetical protein
MPAIIDSSPSCVTSNEGAEPADDSADFILQANYEDCAGFMTFGPGSTYGDEGSGAEAAYMILTWLGIAVTILALVAWVIYENRRLIEYSVRGRLSRGEEPPPQPGIAGE